MTGPVETWSGTEACFGETEGDRRAELHRALLRYFGPGYTGEFSVTFRHGEVVEHTEVTRLTPREEELRDA